MQWILILEVAISSAVAFNVVYTFKIPIRAGKLPVLSSNGSTNAKNCGKIDSKPAMDKGRKSELLE